jgi:hypothetical protein
VLVDKDCGILVKAYPCTIGSTDLFLRTNNHCPGDITLLDLRIGYSFLDGNYDYVSNAGIPATGAAEYSYAAGPLRPGVIGHPQHRLLLDHPRFIPFLDGSLKDLLYEPTLSSAQRPIFLNQYRVPDLTGILGIVRHIFLSSLYILAVNGMLEAATYHNDHGLVVLVAGYRANKRSSKTFARIHTQLHP